MWKSILWALAGVSTSAVFVYFAAQFLTVIFCGYPMTFILRAEFGRNALKTGEICFRYFISLLISGAIMAGVTYAAHRWYNVVGWYAYLIASGIVLFLNIGKYGLTKTNVDEYMKNNIRYIIPAAYESTMRERGLDNEGT